MTRNSINNSSSDLTVSNIELSGSTISTIASNSNLLLAPNGTGQVFAPGISFDSGTNVMSTYLDKTDFVTGIIADDGGSGETYTKNEGWYSIIGNQLFFSVCIIMNSLGTLDGRIAIILPPTADRAISVSNFYCIYENINFTTPEGLGTTGSLVVSANTLICRAQLINDSNLVGNLRIINLQTGSVIRGCGTYILG